MTEPLTPDAVRALIAELSNRAQPIPIEEFDALPDGSEGYFAGCKPIRLVAELGWTPAHSVKRDRPFTLWERGDLRERAAAALSALLPREDALLARVRTAEAERDAARAHAAYAAALITGDARWEEPGDGYGGQEGIWSGENDTPGAYSVPPISEEPKSRGGRLIVCTVDMDSNPEENPHA